MDFASLALGAMLSTVVRGIYGHTNPWAMALVTANESLIIGLILMIFLMTTLYFKGELENHIQPFNIGGPGVTVKSNLRIRPVVQQVERKDAEQEGKDLVAEVLKEIPPETKGERPEWELKTGVHRRENIHAKAVDIDVWKKIQELFDLGYSNPRKLVEVLENKDPFGTDHPEAFTCPSAQSARVDSVKGVSYPFYEYDQAGAAPDAFKKGDRDSFIFYQHLRKAGGTGFCDLAKKNMAREEVPPYYCMPDNRGSLATPPWNEASYLQKQLQAKGHRIASNEWDAWNRAEHIPAKMPKAVFATTFRHPLDRWYSQYRFEHLEHRDGTAADSPRQGFMTYYSKMVGWTEGLNYYVSTFEGEPDGKLAKPGTGDFYWTYHKFQQGYKQQQHHAVEGGVGFPFFKRALIHLQQFHLVLVTEFLDIDSHFDMIHKVLGWTVPPTKTLPHASQADRKEDAATGKTASVRAKDALNHNDYMRLAMENVFDLLMYAVVRRMVLERMTCTGTGVAAEGEGGP